MDWFSIAGVLLPAYVGLSGAVGVCRHWEWAKSAFAKWIKACAWVVANLGEGFAGLIFGVLLAALTFAPVIGWVLVRGCAKIHSDLITGLAKG